MVVVWQVYQVPGGGYESSHGPLRGGEEGKTGSTNQPTNQPTNQQIFTDTFNIFGPILKDPGND